MNPSDRQPEPSAMTIAKSPESSAAAKVLPLEPALADAAALNKCLHESFVELAAGNPDELALLCGDRAMTYGELAEQAEALARELCLRGIGAGDKIGVCLERSPEMVVAVLGILWAGGAYVPLDPGCPVGRMLYVVDDARLSLLITQRKLLDSQLAAAVPSFCIDEPGRSQAGASASSAKLPQVLPEQLAYVIYTSGSTGHPKGVMIDHAGAVNTVADINARFGIGPGDRVLALSSLCFDLSVYDIFGLLSVGGTVVIPEPDRLRDPAYWVELIQRHGVTVWNTVPAHMEMLVTHAQGKSAIDFQSLRRVLLSGDWIPVSLPDRVRGVAPQAEVISLGGATEVSIWSIYFRIGQVDPGWKSIPYGRPLGRQSVYVLDDQMRQCGLGEWGQIHIGGVGVALGYLNRDDLTGQRFVPDCFSDVPGARLYRTGDLGSYRDDGNIEFLGRQDNQVKIHGYRIELGEVESTLVRHAAVAAAAVVARQDASGGKYLAACIVPRRGSTVDDADLIAYLQASLPDYMVPSRFIRLEQLPLNGNGKVDRAAAALLADSRSAAGGQSVPPRDDIEQSLTRIWEFVLALEPIGIRDDFFELGGDSLLATALFAEIESVFGCTLPYSALFDRPTIERLAELLRGAALAPANSRVLLQEGAGLTPLFCVPGIHGSLWEFRRLAQLIHRDLPVYGFEPVGLDGLEPPHQRIGDMAAHYLAGLREIQPQGPYHLLGYSLGGAVAYEMAQRLTAAGETVECLGLLDTPILASSRLMRGLWTLIRESRRVWLNWQGRRFSGQRNRDFRNAAERRYYGVDSFLRNGALPPSRFAVLDTHMRALDAYAPQPYAGPVTIVRAAVPPPWPKRWFFDTSAHWMSLAGDRPDVHVLPGDHSQLFENGNIEKLADVLKCVLLPELQDSSDYLPVAPRHAGASALRAEMATQRR